MDKRKVLRQRSVDKGKQEKLQKKTLVNNLTKLLKKTGDDLTEPDREFLESNDELVETIRGKMSSKETKEDRKKEEAVEEAERDYQENHLEESDENV